MDDFRFDATQHAPAQDISEPVPAGWYATTISGTQIKDTKRGDGKILEVEHTITEGEYKGRKLWSRFNVRNPNAEAERIAKEQLSALCHATGVLKVRAHEQLREKRTLIRVVIKVQDGYEPRNEVKAWKEYAPLSAATPARAQAEDPDAWRKNVDDDLPF